MPHAPNDPGTEIGASGLQHFDGFVFDEKLKALEQPGKRNAIYREMSDNDPIISAVLFVIEMLIRQVQWDVRPHEDLDEGDEDKERVDLIKGALFNDLNKSFTNVVSEIMSLLQYGWSWHEIVFKRRLGQQPPILLDEAGKPLPGQFNPLPSSKFNDGKWGWHKFAGRAQETLFRWQFDEHGEVLAMVQAPPPDYKLLAMPMHKSLHFRTSTRRNNPEGKSILRGAYRPWFFKKTIEEVQAIGIERDLTGLPVMRVPSNLLNTSSNMTNAESAEQTSLQETIRNIRRGAQEGLLLPNMRDNKGNYEYTLELLATGGRRVFDTKGIMEMYDQRMAMMAVADFILLGHEKVGSFALASSKTDIFAMAVGAWLQTIADEFNDKAIPQLLELNGMDSELSPQLTFEDIEKLSLEDLSGYITALSGAGMALFPDDTLESHLREAAGLPEPEEGADGPVALRPEPAAQKAPPEEEEPPIPSP